MKIIRNIILVILVFLAVFLSSKVWFEFPFFTEEKQDDNYIVNYSDIDIWKIVRPSKYLLSDKEKKAYINIENEDVVWNMILDELTNVFINFTTTNHSLLVGEVYPDKYLICEFEKKISSDIFFQGLGIDKNNIKTRLTYISKIAIDIENPGDIYIFNGDSTVVMKNTMFSGSQVLSKIKEISRLSESVVDKCQVNGENYQIPHVKTSLALNPVFVKAEFNVNDVAYIDNIAKNFFRNDYDYVRRSMEQNGNVNFVYKNEKVLKITSEGLFDFFDAKFSIKNEKNIYESLKIAISFSNDFINLPDNFYLLSSESIQKDGVQGYKFTFTYDIYDKTVLFSRVRNNSPLEIEVVDGKVISYKRLLRDIDKSMIEFAEDVNILNLDEVLSKNVKLEDETDDLSLKILDKDMLKSIDSAYLAYFDRAQKINRQQLIVVWVVEIGENTYIFNAITGSLLEQW